MEWDRRTTVNSTTSTGSSRESRRRWRRSNCWASRRWRYSRRPAASAWAWPPRPRPRAGGASCERVLPALRPHAPRGPALPVQAEAQAQAYGGRRHEGRARAMARRVLVERVPHGEAEGHRQAAGQMRRLRQGVRRVPRRPLVHGRNGRRGGPRPRAVRGRRQRGGEPHAAVQELPQEAR
nr:MAG TPA: hypothetical protein [Caudoviricetes sp.]